MRSRIPFPVSDKVGIIRKTERMVGGLIKPACEDVIVYEKVPARVGELRKLEENRTSPKGHGDSASKLRKIQIGGNNMPDKIQDGDYVRIYWGTQPNVLVPLGVPSGYGPWIQITTPGGVETLKWNGTKWLNENYSLEYAPYEGAWVLIDGVDIIAEFGPESNPQIKCGTFPTGYSYLKITGSPIDYKINQYQHKRDDNGYWHHTSLQVDLVAFDRGPRV